MTLNERLQFYRKRAGLSQEEVAAALSVTRQAVSKWETGAAVPDLETLARLADILGHTNVSTTRIYTVESGAAHRRQMERMGLVIT